MKLRVSLTSDNSLPGSHKYDHKVNADNFKDVALVLLDLANHGVPIKKAIIEYFKLIKTDWESIIGI